MSELDESSAVRDKDIVGKIKSGFATIAELGNYLFRMQKRIKKLDNAKKRSQNP
jgi:hypothetical protein